jgi:hypothetical protein
VDEWAKKVRERPLVERPLIGRTLACHHLLHVFN